MLYKWVDCLMMGNSAHMSKGSTALGQAVRVLGGTECVFKLCPCGCFSSRCKMFGQATDEYN